MFFSSFSDKPPPREFIRFLIGPASIAMVAMILLQELLGAGTTWLVIQIARDIADGHVALPMFGWIVLVQSAAYFAGAASWLFAERAGFSAYARYVLRFAQANRHQSALLHDTDSREGTEPFLTSEAFQISFNLIYDLQFDCRLIFNLLFNAIVFGLEIDAALPAAYALAFVILATLQWSLRKPLASAYLHNQSMTNRMTARTYNAWDNVTAGNRHNLHLWQRDFRARWDQALAAQVRAILMREGWSAASGVIALLIVLSATAWVAFEDAGNAALLIGLAATLPRQLEMTLDMHQLTAGLTDLIAIWARMQGACEHLRPIPGSNFDTRIQFAMISLRIDDQDRPVSSLAEALSLIHAQPVGRIAVRGANGAGKSTLLTALKGSLRGSAYYWPNHDRLSFRFNTRNAPVAAVETEEDEAPEAEEINASESALEKAGYSSGERQLQVLRELVEHTDNPVYLLDEWDANLDPKNREEAEQLLQLLARRARVIEVSHHRG